MNATELKELETLLKLTWNNDQKMVEHCIKSSKYIKLGNMFVDVANAKPSITKTIWYDDTREDPGSDWNTFYNLNMRNVSKLYELNSNRWGDRESLTIATQYYGDKMGGLVCGLRYESEEADSRRVTADELILINNAVEEVRTDYIKRLENYYKKYNKNVVSCGYWADR